jgi:hypothetical protein
MRKLRKLLHFDPSLYLFFVTLNHLTETGNSYVRIYLIKDKTNTNKYKILIKLITTTSLNTTDEGISMLLSIKTQVIDKHYMYRFKLK